jgi:hypothetical protein
MNLYTMYEFLPLVCELRTLIGMTNRFFRVSNLYTVARVAMSSLAACRRQHVVSGSQAVPTLTSTQLYHFLVS